MGISAMIGKWFKKKEIVVIHPPIEVKIPIISRNPIIPNPGPKPREESFRVPFRFHGGIPRQSSLGDGDLGIGSAPVTAWRWSTAAEEERGNVINGMESETWAARQ